MGLTGCRETSVSNYQHDCEVLLLHSMMAQWQTAYSHWAVEQQERGYPLREVEG